MELLSSRTAVPGLQGGVEGACNGEKGGEARDVGQGKWRGQDKVLGEERMDTYHINPPTHSHYKVLSPILPGNNAVHAY